VSGRLLKILICGLLVLGVAFAVGCGSSDDSSDSSSSTSESADSTDAQTETAKATGLEDITAKPKITVPDGPAPKQLEKIDIIEGDGVVAKAGDTVVVQYVGVGYDSGEEFDTSWGGEPFSFTLGNEEVIAGWEEGIEGMKTSGRRELIIPANLAYGPTGRPPAIKPNEALIFMVDLLAAE